MNILEDFNILNYKIEGDLTFNLKDCLNKTPMLKKMFISSCLDIVLNKKKIDCSIDENLEKKIIAACKVLINSPFFYQNEIKNIQETSTEGIEILVIFGMQYCFEKDGQDTYVIPKEILKVFKKTVTEEYLQKHKEEIINRSIDIILYSFGVIEKDVLEAWLQYFFPNESLDLKKVLSKKYLIKGNLCMVNYLKDKEEYVDTIIHKPCSLKNHLIFYFLSDNFCQNYNNFVAKLDESGYAGEEILFRILASDNKEKIMDELDDLYQFNDQAKKIVKQFLNHFDESDLWKYRGLGRFFLESQKCLKTVQVKKTSETENVPLINCLNNMLPRNYIELVKRLKLKPNAKVETVAKKIMKNLDKYLNKLNDKDVEKILDFDDSFIPTLAENGFVFSKVKYDYLEPFFPAEIEKTLDDYLDDNSLEDLFRNYVNDVIDEYMDLNGLLPKTKLQKLLKDNHELEIKLDTLDIILKDYYMTENFYSKFEIDEEECQKLYEFKEKFGDFCKLSKEKIQAEDNLIDELLNLLSPVAGEEESHDLISGLLFTIKMSIYNKKTLEMILEEENIKLLPNKIDQMHKIIVRYKDDIGLWLKNGYSQNELNQRNKLKVGRNDPCPCGSGKKYKKCCGK